MVKDNYLADLLVRCGRKAVALSIRRDVLRPILVELIARRTAEGRPSSSSVGSSFKHGHTRALPGGRTWQSPTYRTWMNMRVRCGHVGAGHPSYTTKGIRVAHRWLGKRGFENFLADMGERPPGKTLDRKKRWLGYSPKNCRWATIGEQNSNKSDNRFVTFRGQRRTVTSWCRMLRLSHRLVLNRLWRGWSTRRAFLTPTRTYKRKSS